MPMLVEGLSAPTDQDRDQFNLNPAAGLRNSPCPLRKSAAATALAEDEYDGVISLDSVYHPTGGTFEEGFQASVGRFKEIFG